MMGSEALSESDFRPVPGRGAEPPPPETVYLFGLLESPEMVAKEQAREKVRGLVERFSGLVGQGQVNSYNESLLKQNFVVPLFEALGWDVKGENARTPLELEVLVEETGKDRGRPDYEFRILGKTKFFMEVKRPSVGVADPSSVLQAKSYSWSANTPFAVLTDFQEIQLYETTIPPSRKNPRQGLRLKLLCEEFVGRFDDLWVLSKESVTAGALQGLQLKGKEARDREPVDARFLKELQHWREVLAKDLYKQNSRVSVQLLNEVVQRMLDRMVFVRIAEDRGVLERDQLKRVAEKYRESGGHIAVHDLLLRVFHEVNAKLNGEIFKPGHAVEQEEYWFDSAPLVKVIEWLYEEDPGYRFDVIPVELLGTIYERYLGNTIRLTEKRVKVEEKPEVRKAGGVFYTPKYIVDYIVENTVGKLIEGKSPDEVAKIKILDPACGSGSFLLGAYQKLIDHHIRWYQAHSEQAAGRFVPNGGGQPRLTIEEKARILRNNIHGVDIDQQAVEITMMSLYVKALEGERVVPAGRDLLPRLSKNIVCGNSLIGTDAREVLGRELTGEEARRVNAFDWRTGFADIFERGGFDAVIGNPPYLFITELDDMQKKYFFGKYECAEYRFDVYGLFMEMAIRELLCDSGYLSFIIPHTLLSNDSFEKLRKKVLNETSLDLVIDIGPGVFEGARNETMIFSLRRGRTPTTGQRTQVILTDAEQFPKPSKEFYIQQQAWLRNPKASWLVKVSTAEIQVVDRLEKAKLRLGDICTINQGLRTGDNEKYLANSQKSGKWKPAAGGKEVGRYEPLVRELFVYYEPEVLDAPRKRELFESPEKVVIQEIRNITLPRRLIATYDDQQVYCLQSTNVINLRQAASGWRIKGLLAVINSNAANFFFRQRFPGNNHIASNQLAQIPIPKIDRAAHDELVRLVERMLELHKQRAPLPESNERTRVEREIAAADERIDDIVYKLYGITEEERKIIEGGG